MAACRVRADEHLAKQRILWLSLRLRSRIRWGALQAQVSSRVISEGDSIVSMAYLYRGFRSRPTLEGLLVESIANSETLVTVMRELWSEGVSIFKGKHFTMNDCKLLPKPSQPIKVIAAGQSPRGTKFAAEYADYNFCGASGHNNPQSFEKGKTALVEAAKQSGRDVGTLALFLILAYETDDKAWAKWDWYSEGVDLDATGWIAKQATKDVKADASATASRIRRADNPVNLNGGALIGSFEKVAGFLDQVRLLKNTMP
jgi:pyrimidine oxygenase